ncbi:MAG TPA: energy transducer TonB [Pyrinomonadaceae bacterium]|nr:energy transducer TonB [Pyrinomonadaceae bacterium]
MRTTLLRLAVALATFGLGVTLATIWLALGTSGHKLNYKRESCRWRERAVLAPVPPPPPVPMVAPLAPVPPQVAETLRAETCEGTADGRTITGGGLNSKAISKPNPKYPAEAMAAQVSGMVVVQITVDECGDVEKAEVASGHPLLREAALDAAYKARFSPTRLSGEPVKVKGVISYDFFVR